MGVLSYLEGVLAAIGFSDPFEYETDLPEEIDLLVMTLPAVNE